MSTPESWRAAGAVGGRWTQAEIEELRHLLLADPVFRGNRVWVPVDALQIVSAPGQTAAIAETTVMLARQGLAVPPNAAACQYRFDIKQNSGTGQASVVLKHKPGGSAPAAAWSRPAELGIPDGQAATIDFNRGRLTYQTFTIGTVNYDLTIYLTGIWRAP